MRILDADEASGLVEGIVHLDTQRATGGIDLTVAGVARVAGGGRLDFGSSEFETADRDPVAPELAGPDDDYGWWTLESGSYLVRYNEALALPAGRVGLITPLPRLLRAGASHPALVVTAEERGAAGEESGPGTAPEVLLTVGGGGCDLKENCRISRLLVFAES